MDMDRLREIQKDVVRFLASDERIFSFHVDCPLPERIGYIYRAIFPGAARIRFYLRFALARVAQCLDYSPLKVLLYRLIGIRIGKGVFIAADVVIDVHFPSLVAIEDYAILGWGVRLFTHEFIDGRYRIGRIRVGEGALVGAFAMVRGGVTIGREAQVPCGSLIHRDLAAGARPGVREFMGGRDSRE